MQITLSVAICFCLLSPLSIYLNYYIDINVIYRFVWFHNLKQGIFPNSISFAMKEKKTNSRVSDVNPCRSEIFRSTSLGSRCLETRTDACGKPMTQTQASRRCRACNWIAMRKFKVLPGFGNPLYFVRFQRPYAFSIQRKRDRLPLSLPPCRERRFKNKPIVCAELSLIGRHDRR